MTWEVPGFRVEQLVGSGSSGEVWRARRIDDDEVVALKRIRIDDAGLLRAARAEAALLAAFDHPHILKLHELIVVERDAVLVLEFAEGGSLEEVLEHRGRLAPGEVATIVAPIAAALAAAHSEGVVHSDVSPGNILFTRDGRPLLGDLGVARLCGQSDDVVRATPGYLDSAVAAGGLPGPHSDVFSLAAVAWRALTGRPVWDSPTPRESLVMAAQGAVPPLRDIVPSVPEGLAAAIDRALQRDTHLRGAAAELALDVRHAVEPVPVDGWSGRRSGAAGAAGPVDGADRERWRTATGRALGDTPPTGDGRETGRGRESGDGHTTHGGGSAPATGQQGRHSAPASAVATPSRPDLPTAGRPTFRRPAPADISRVGPNARTRVVRPAPAARAHARTRDEPCRRLAPIAVTAALIAAVLVGAWWARLGAGAASEADPAATGASQSPTATGASQSPTTAPSESTESFDEQSDSAGTETPGSQGSDEFAVWEKELARLDGIRQRAYAQGDAQLLAGVYTGDLLDADVTQLHELVPTGCGLQGASSRYDIHSATATGALPAERRVVIAADVTLAAGRLVCDGAAYGTSAAIGPVSLQLVLVSGPDGMWRVGEQRRI